MLDLFHYYTAQRSRTFFVGVIFMGSSVGIATGYGLDGTGSNPDGGEIFRTCPDRIWGPRSLLYNGHRVFPGGKERPGRDADPSPPSNAVVMKGYSYTSTPPYGQYGL